MDIIKYEEIFKVLSDSNRLRIIELLKSGEMCSCCIHQKLSLPQNLTSHHLGILRDAKVLNARKEGRWVHYSLNPDFSIKFKKDINNFI